MAGRHPIDDVIDVVVEYRYLPFIHFLRVRGLRTVAPKLRYLDVEPCLIRRDVVIPAERTRAAENVVVVAVVRSRSVSARMRGRLKIMRLEASVVAEDDRRYYVGTKAGWLVVRKRATDPLTILNLLLLSDVVDAGSYYRKLTESSGVKKFFQEEFNGSYEEVLRRLAGEHLRRLRVPSLEYNVITHVSLGCPAARGIVIRSVLKIYDRGIDVISRLAGLIVSVKNDSEDYLFFTRPVLGRLVSYLGMETAFRWLVDVLNKVEEYAKKALLLSAFIRYYVE